MKRIVRKGTIEIRRRDVETMIHDLSLVVVSLDRLGSTYYNRPRKLDAETIRFLNSVKLFRRLARIRGVLSEAYNVQTSKAAVRRLEEKGEKLAYWKEKR